MKDWPQSPQPKHLEFDNGLRFPFNVLTVDSKLPFLFTPHKDGRFTVARVSWQAVPLKATARPTLNRSAEVASFLLTDLPRAPQNFCAPSSDESVPGPILVVSHLRHP